jgi:hypothetical protein
MRNAPVRKNMDKSNASTMRSTGKKSFLVKKNVSDFMLLGVS